ncbi:MAG: hypothetical protein HY721_31085, partial [Planctomycetes bacterium]|nr:hypothetical protein [Planctomycetota bacterium]
MVACDCRPGLPCACERRAWDALSRAASRDLGHAVGGLVTSALLDVLRAMRHGNEAEVRSTRAALIGVLLRHDAARRSLALQEERLA